VIADKALALLLRADPRFTIAEEDSQALVFQRRQEQLGIAGCLTC
jgi:hypothetical protein